MSKNIQYQKNHILIEFKDFLDDLCCKFDVNTIVNVDFSERSFNKIAGLISPYVCSKKETTIKIIEQLLEAIPGYRRDFLVRNQVLSNNLFFRAVVKNLEQNYFWSLPEYYISVWYDLSYTKQLNYKQSQILLACFWCHNFYGSLRKTKIPFLRTGEIKELTRFSEDTVRKHLVELSKKDLIKINLSKRREKYTLKSLPKTSKIFQYSNNPHIYSILSNINVNDIRITRFIYSKDFNSNNPFLYIYPKGDIVVNRQILNMEYIISSILSEDKLRNLLLISHNKRSINYTVKSIKNHLENYFSIIKNTKPPTDLSPHFYQIYKILPLLDYIGRRYFEIDFDKIQHFSHYNKYRMEVAKKKFYEYYTILKKTEPELLDWDVEYLFNCLGKNNSEKEWQKQRNNKNTKINWQFTNEDARIKLKRLYPVII